MSKNRCYCKSSWQIRNNSANVAEVLHPNTKPKQQWRNTCYCDENNIPPRLFSRPKHCILNEEKNESKKHCLKPFIPKQFVKNSETKTILNSRYFNNSFPQTENNESEINEDKIIEYLPAVSATKFQETEDEPIELSQNLLEKNTKTSSEYPETTTDNDFVQKLSIIETSSKLSLQNDDESTDLKKIKDFRNDYYFETHSTEDLNKTIPNHVCVHRFGLDERLLAYPLNGDVYDSSRCIICGKAMKNLQTNQIDERNLKNQKNIFPKFYKYGLVPKKIYMANDDIKIEMKLDNFGKMCDMKGLKKPNYFQTYALRYQKGVL